MEPVFDKVVILSATSGVGLSSFRRLAEGLFGEQAFYADYEEYVKNTGKTGIYSMASGLLWSPRSALSVFEEAFNAMRSDALEAKRRGAKIAFIETHLSYISIHMLIPNPMIDKIISLGRETTLIYYIEDFYHALLRMARSLKEKSNLYRAEGFYIDPLNYMTWRGLDHSLINMLRARYTGTLEALIAGAKHPEETHKRLLEYSSHPRLRGRLEYMLAYVSHPITAVRREYMAMKSAGKLKSISQHAFVADFEEFKRNLIHECPRLILFEPTTIDELSGEVSTENDGKEYIVTREDRWPHARVKEYERMYPVDIFDRETFAILYGGGYQGGSTPVSASILDHEEARTYYLKRLEAMIRDQIEVRDYEYVSQSSSIIAYEPVYNYRYLAERNSSPSRGAMKELARAESQSKSIYIVAPTQEAATSFVNATSGLFGEKTAPIVLSDPRNPKELVEILAEAGFCG